MDKLSFAFIPNRIHNFHYLHHIHIHTDTLGNTYPDAIKRLLNLNETIDESTSSILISFIRCVEEFQTIILQFRGFNKRNDEIVWSETQWRPMGLSNRIRLSKLSMEFRLGIKCQDDLRNMQKMFFTFTEHRQWEANKTVINTSINYICLMSTQRLTHFASTTR